jgi:hypothetical protein
MQKQHVNKLILHRLNRYEVSCSVAEPHHFNTAMAPGKNFDAAKAPAAHAPTLLIAGQNF